MSAAIRSMSWPIRVAVASVTFSAVVSVVVGHYLIAVWQAVVLLWIFEAARQRARFDASVATTRQLIAATEEYVQSVDALIAAVERRKRA